MVIIHSCLEQISHTTPPLFAQAAYNHIKNLFSVFLLMCFISLRANELLSLALFRRSGRRFVVILLHLDFYFFVAILLLERAWILRILWYLHR